MTSQHNYLVCEYPHCKAKAEYNDEVATDDSGEQLIEVHFCRVHHNVLLNYNDDKDPYEWSKLTPKEKRQVSQIVYRLFSKGG